MLLISNIARVLSPAQVSVWTFPSASISKQHIQAARAFDAYHN